MNDRLPVFNTQDEHPIFSPLDEVNLQEFADRQPRETPAYTGNTGGWYVRAAASIAVLCAIASPVNSGQFDGPKSLFTAATFPAGWSFYSAENGTKLRDVWWANKAANGGDDVFEVAIRVF